MKAEALTDAVTETLVEMEAEKLMDTMVEIKAEIVVVDALGDTLAEVGTRH